MVCPVNAKLSSCVCLPALVLLSIACLLMSILKGWGDLYLTVMGFFFSYHIIWEIIMDGKAAVFGASSLVKSKTCIVTVT